VNILEKIRNMSFEIEYDKQSQKFLKKLDKYLISGIMDKIDNLLINNPVPHNAKVVVGKRGV